MEYKKLGEIYDFQYGKGNTNPDNGGIYPIYGSNGIIGGYDQYNSEDSPVIGHIGANCGSVVWAKGKHFVTYNGIICKIKNGFDARFGYYSLLSANLKSKRRGCAQPFISYDLLDKTNVYCPSLPLQRRIASILSSYDNLIEANSRRIKILEQMAENLYKEWFAYKKIHNSAKQVKIKDIISITRGISYSSAEIDCEDGVDLINLKNIQGFGGFRLDGTKKYNGKYKSSQIVKTGDLVMGVTDMTQDRRTVGHVALIPHTSNVSVISADLIKLSSQIDSTYLYVMFRYGNVSRHISQFANGSNVLHLRPQVVENVKILLPEQELIDKFVSIIKPIFSQINTLQLQSANLTRQRDLLLQRLMSGQLTPLPINKSHRL